MEKRVRCCVLWNWNTPSFPAVFETTSLAVVLLFAFWTFAITKVFQQTIETFQAREVNEDDLRCGHNRTASSRRKQS
jgi:hypothetical protein